MKKISNKGNNHAWWIVVVTFLFMFLYVGLGRTMYFSLVSSFSEELQWNRASIYFAITISGLAMGFVAPIVGKILDKNGPSNIMSIGGFITMIGFMLLSYMQSVWQLWLGYLFIGIGITCFGLIPCTYLINHCFSEKRGLASGIMMAGGGIGALIIAPLTGSFFLPNFGWRITFLIAAMMIFFCVVPLSLSVIRFLYIQGQRKKNNHQYKDSSESEVLPKTNRVEKGMTLKEAIRNLDFWKVTIAFTFTGFTWSAIQSLQVPMVEDLGVSLALASGALGVVGLFTTIGRLLFGWLFDLIDSKITTILGLTCLLLSTITLKSLGPESPVFVLYVYSILQGLGIGAFFPAMNLLTVHVFGLATFGTIFGIISAIESLIGNFSPTLAAMVYDSQGSYSIVFIYSALLIASAIVLVFLIKPKK